MNEVDRDEMRRQDHDMLIRMDACLKGMVRTQKEQGEQIKDLYEKITPMSQWIGTANSGFKLLSYLGVVVVVVALVWNTISTGVTMVMRTITHENTRGSVVINPGAKLPDNEVTRKKPDE